jgi:hypothetical protein
LQTPRKRIKVSALLTAKKHKKKKLKRLLFEQGSAARKPSPSHLVDI